jgi:hypothetical protein
MSQKFPLFVPVLKWSYIRTQGTYKQMSKGNNYNFNQQIKKKKKKFTRDKISDLPLSQYA